MDPVTEAVNRRAGGAPTPQLSQVSGDARMASGGVPPEMPMSQMTSTSNPQAASPTQSQKYQPQNQQDMIVAALVEQLKSTNSLEKEKMKLSAGQMSQTPQMAPETPVGQSQAPTPESYLTTPQMATSQMQSPF